MLLFVLLPVFVMSGVSALAVPVNKSGKAKEIDDTINIHCPSLNKSEVVRKFSLDLEDPLSLAVLDMSIQFCNNTFYPTIDLTFKCPLIQKPNMTLLQHDVINNLANRNDCEKICKDKKPLCATVAAYVQLITKGNGTVVKQTDISAPPVADAIPQDVQKPNFITSKDDVLTKKVNVSGVVPSLKVEKPDVTTVVDNPTTMPKSVVQSEQATIKEEKPSTEIATHEEQVKDQDVDDVAPITVKAKTGNDHLPSENDSEYADRNDDDGDDAVNIDDDADIRPEVVPPALKDITSFDEQPKQINTGDPFVTEDSHFFSYFLTFTCLTVMGYIAFHNKNKILALALEGRRGRNGRKRPNSSNYKMLDTSLEEAMMSDPSSAPSTRVIY